MTSRMCAKSHTHRVSLSSTREHLPEDHRSCTTRSSTRLVTSCGTFHMSSRRAERSTIGWRLGLLLTVSLGGAVGHPFHVEKLVVLHRHGSRTHLSKEHATLAEGGATLTPLGQRQLYQVRACLPSPLHYHPNLFVRPRGLSVLR